MREYFDKDGKQMTKEDIQQLPAEKLEERSGIKIEIIPDYDNLYDAVAEMMIDVIEKKKGEKVSMILPVGPSRQYPILARKIKERNISIKNLWTFNMDEFLDRNGKTIPEENPMSFKRVMFEDFYDLIPEELRKGDEL